MTNQVTGEVVTGSARVETMREAWPDQPITEYEDINSHGWGYLVFFNNGEFEFQLEQRPSDDEIMKRWGRYLNRQNKSE